MRFGQLQSSCQLSQAASTKTTASSYSSSLSCRTHLLALTAHARAMKSASSARIANSALNSAIQASRRAVTQQEGHTLTVLQGYGAHRPFHSTNRIITQYAGVKTHHV